MRVRLSFIFILCLWIFTGCQSSPENKDNQESIPIPSDMPARQILEAHLDALYTQADFSRAYDFISTQDQQLKSRSDYIKIWQASPTGQQLKKKITYQIQSFQKELKEVKAKVELTHPDIEKMVNDLLNSNAKGLEALKSELDKQIKDKIPMVRQQEIIHLIQENDQWRIFNNWSEQNKQKALRVKHLIIGDKDTILEHPEEGNVELSILKTRVVSQKKDGDKKFCVVEVQLTSHLKRKKFEQLGWMVTIEPVVKDDKGRVYKANFDLIPVIDDTPYTNPFLKNAEPLLPGQSSTGELLFIIDKEAKGLKLEFDANWSSQEGKTLLFDLDKKRTP